MEVVEVDVHDEASLREFYSVGQASVVNDRPHQFSRTFQALSNSVREPGAYSRSTLLAAMADGRMIGVADLTILLQDNLHLADIEIHVHPAFRRRGVGRALHGEADRRRVHAGRSVLCCEVFELAGGEGSAGLEFAAAFGYRSAHVEDHLVLDLPVAPSAVTALAGRLETTSYDVVTWGNRCPDEYAEAYCAMKTQMSSDVPVGEVDYHPIVYDTARLRSQEERTARSYRQLIAAVRRRSDAMMAGYSQVFLPLGDTGAIQDDTLVMPEHRGHRLGTALKLANLETMHREHPERRVLHTWTDPENHAMYRTNTDFGYVVAERMHEMQRSDG